METVIYYRKDFEFQCKRVSLLKVKQICDLQRKNKKNPAYGRQIISRLMWIVAPMPQESGPRIPQNPIFWENGKNHLKRKKSSKTQKLKNVQKYANISNTPFNQRSLIHREAWFPGGPRIPKNPIFLKTEKIIQNAKTQKRLPEVSSPLGSVVFTMFSKAKSAKNKTFFCAAIFDHLKKNVQI